jgi:ABC-type nitrate/sulfonate/bicarbonate transport system substrate-binding protein
MTCLRAWLRPLAAVLAFGGGVLLAPAAPRAEEAPLAITIGYQADAAWLQFEARQLHLFEKVGLTPKYVKFLAGAPMIAAAESGGIDIAVPGIVPFLTGVGQGVPWIAVGIDAAGATEEVFVARKDAGIDRIADLKGKKVGYFRASTAHYALITGLRQNGVNPDDVHLLHMAPAQQLAAMINNDIDAAEVWEPWISKMLHQGNGKVLKTEADLGIYTAVGVAAVRRDWLASHRETLRRYLEALLLAQQSLAKDSSPAIQFLSQEMGIPVDWAQKIYDDEKPAMTRWLDLRYPYSLAENGKLRKNLAEVAAFLYDEKVIPKPVDTSDLLDTSVLADVLRSAKQ